MHKKTLFAAAILALTATAHAQINAGSRPPPAPASTAPAAPTAAPAQAPMAAPQGVNPFTGKALSLEQRQRSLEIAKMETSLMEEQLKQASLTEDMAVMPLKKQVETAQATTARMKEEMLQKEVANAPKLAAMAAANAQKGMNPMPMPAAAKAKARPPVKKSKPANEDAARAKPVAPPPPQPRVEVTTIMNFSGTRAAVLDIDGNILTVKHGDNTPVGAIEILDDHSVRINGRALKVHGATLARVVISDPKPVDPKAPVAAPALPTPSVSQTSAPMATFPGPGGQMPMGRNGQPSLPPLQLPAGVTLLPATAN